MAEQRTNKQPARVIEWPDYENEGRAQRARELLREYDARQLTEFDGMQDYEDVQKLLQERKKATEHAG